MIYDPALVVKSEVGKEDTIWYDVTENPFELYGLDGDENDFLSCRIPAGVAEKISRGIFHDRAYGSGGHVRFGTDSPYIMIKAEFGAGVIHNVCSQCFCYGFDLYVCEEDGKESFRHLYRVPDDFDRKSYISQYDARIYEEGFAYYTLNFPCFAELEKLYIGIKAGSKLSEGKKYINAKPVIFYGSSITHGAAASRPGNTYENFIAQKYNLNVVNLGFSGKAKGEAEMAKYIAGRAMEAFVCDYDHNAKRVAHLQDTHYPFYEIIRQKHPDIPYIMVSGADTRRKHDPNEFDGWRERRAVIIESYEKARAAGDQNVYFIDGETLLAGEHALSCTADGGHPNDLGFYRMAQVIGGHLEKILKL